jgi:hypothetical protein
MRGHGTPAPKGVAATSDTATWDIPSCSRGKRKRMANQSSLMEVKWYWIETSSRFSRERNID